jgi:hypothetical protein
MLLLSAYPMCFSKKSTHSSNTFEEVLRFVTKSVSFLFSHPYSLEYQIQLMVAIDFTASNGNPNLPSSLHHVRGSELNPYEQALSTVGEILLPYDSDQRVPMYGFGAKLNGNSPCLQASVVCILRIMKSSGSAAHFSFDGSCRSNIALFSFEW